MPNQNCVRRGGVDKGAAEVVVGRENGGGEEDDRWRRVGLCTTIRGSVATESSTYGLDYASAFTIGICIL